MRSYCPTAPKLLPPSVGDAVLVITTCVTRACTDDALQSTTPVNERQQATAVFENGVPVIRASRGACSGVGRHLTGRYGWREALRLLRDHQKDRRSLFPAGYRRGMRVWFRRTASVRYLCPHV